MYAKKYLFFCPCGVLVPTQQPTSTFIPNGQSGKSQAKVHQIPFPRWYQRTQEAASLWICPIPASTNLWLIVAFSLYLLLFLSFFLLSRGPIEMNLWKPCKVLPFHLLCILCFILKIVFCFPGQKIMSNCYIFPKLYLPSLGSLFQSFTALR